MRMYSIISLHFLNLFFYCFVTFCRQDHLHINVIIEQNIPYLLELNPGGSIISNGSDPGGVFEGAYNISIDIFRLNIPLFEHICHCFGCLSDKNRLVSSKDDEFLHKKSFYDIKLYFDTSEYKKNSLKK